MTKIIILVAVFSAITGCSVKPPPPSPVGDISQVNPPKVNLTDLFLKERVISND